MWDLWWANWGDSKYPQSISVFLANCWSTKGSKTSRIDTLEAYVSSYLVPPHSKGYVNIWELLTQSLSLKLTESCLAWSCGSGVQAKLMQCCPLWGTAWSEACVPATEALCCGHYVAFQYICSLERCIPPVELKPVRVDGVGHSRAGRGILHQLVLQAVTQLSLSQFTDLSLPLLALQVLQFQPGMTSNISNHSRLPSIVGGFTNNRKPYMMWPMARLVDDSTHLSLAVGPYMLFNW